MASTCLLACGPDWDAQVILCYGDHPHSEEEVEACWVLAGIRGVYPQSDGEGKACWVLVGLQKKKDKLQRESCVEKQEVQNDPVQ